MGSGYETGATRGVAEKNAAEKRMLHLREPRRAPRTLEPKDEVERDG